MAKKASLFSPIRRLFYNHDHTDPSCLHELAKERMSSVTDASQYQCLGLGLIEELAQDVKIFT